LGIGGASYAYMQTEEGRIQSAAAFTWVEELLGLASAPPKLNVKDSVRLETKGSASKSTIANTTKPKTESKAEKILVAENPAM